MYKFSVKFYWDGSPDVPTATIMCRVTHAQKRLFFSAGFSLPKAHWDHAKQQVVKNPRRAEYNGQLDSLRAEIQQQAAKAAALEQALLPFLKEQMQPDRRTGTRLYEVLEDFLKTQRNEVTEGTLKQYRGLLNDLREFEAETGYRVEFQTLSPEFGQRWIEYLLHTKGNNDNTVQKKLKNLKAFLAKLEKWGKLPKYVQYGHLGHKAETAIKHVALSQAELDQVAALPLEGQPGKDRARDFFVLACYTGLRISDLRQLKPEHYTTLEMDGKAVPVVQLRTMKTHTRVTIPLRPAARAVIERWGLPLPLLSDQKHNEYLKEIARAAGLDYPVEVVDFHASVRTAQQVPKWQLVTSHTARRTFATLEAKAGLPLNFIREVLGHKSIQQTVHYIRDTGELLETDLLRLWETDTPRPTQPQ